MCKGNVCDLKKKIMNKTIKVVRNSRIAESHSSNHFTNSVPRKIRLYEMTNIQYAVLEERKNCPS